jgi:hypothetical protein
MDDCVKRPLTNIQIENNVGIPQEKIIVYSHLRNYDSITDLLQDGDFRIILIELKPNNGHYVAIYRRNNDIIYFDSYGIIADGELKWVSSFYRHLLGEDHKEIHRLCRNFKLICNRIKFQGNTSSTCGRYCILFIEMSKMGYSLTEIQDFLKRSKGNGSYDKLMCRLVSF